MKVTFLLLGDDLALLERLDPDADWREFVAGERVWIVQTYLRLRALGHPVALSDTLPREGVVVFSTKQRRLLRPFRTAATLVGVRQDLGPALIADVEVVQNLGQADGRRRHMIPHWPQPGLVPRDPARGPAIRVVAFKGGARLWCSSSLTRSSRGIEKDSGSIGDGRAGNVWDGRECRRKSKT